MKRVVILGCILLGQIGCRSIDETNSDVDQSRARETLVTALDAWKSGQPRTLAKLNPPIRFGDDDLQAGLQLQNYEISEPNQPIHPFRDVKVVLTLRDRRGKVLTKTAAYQVGLDPSLSVLRSDN